MRNARKTGFTCAAFGVGLLVSVILPTKCVFVLAAVTLIATGCSCAKKL